MHKIWANEYVQFYEAIFGPPQPQVLAFIKSALHFRSSVIILKVQNFLRDDLSVWVIFVNISLNIVFMSRSTLSSIVEMVTLKDFVFSSSTVPFSLKKDCLPWAP